MAVLRHDALGQVLLFGILVVIILAVEEHDLVRILLNGAGLAQIGQHRALILSAFIGAGELRQAQHRHIQLLCHDLQGTGDIRNHLLPVFTAVAFAAGGDH